MLGLVGCGRPLGSFDAAPSTKTKLDSLVALVQFKKPPKQEQPSDLLRCPNITVLDGTADDRVFGRGPQSNANVDYQFSLDDFARDCKVVGNKLDIKVGVRGRVLLGPVGKPGTFAAPVRVAVLLNSDPMPLVSNLYHVDVSVPADGSAAPFTLVTDALNVPYTHPHAELDYTIKVGFDPAGKSPRWRKYRKR